MKRVFYIYMAAMSVIAGAVGCARRGAQPGAAREIHVEVTDRGFVPAETVIPKDQAVTLVVTRKTDQTCATEIVLPALNQRHALPLDQPVRIAIPAGAPDTLNYACGMDMLRGSIVAK